MLRAILQFIRPRILITCSLILFLSALQIGTLSTKTVFGVLILITWYIHASTSNDYADRKIDSINLAGDSARPMVVRSLSVGQLWIVHGIAGCLALIFSLIYQTPVTLIVLVTLLLDYLYSFRPFLLSYRGIIAQLTLPIAYVVLPYIIGHYSVSTTQPPILLIAGLYTGFTARLFLKDFRDIKGDKKYGKKTFLVRHGIKATAYASALASIVSLLLILAFVNYAWAITMVLVIGQLLVLRELRRLIKTNTYKEQSPIIKRVAKLANGSVVCLVVLCGSRALFNEGPALSVLPLTVGCVWFIYVNNSKIL